MQESSQESSFEKICPFMKDRCRPDCMLRMSSAEKVTAQCALSVLANQMVIITERQKKF